MGLQDVVHGHARVGQQAVGGRRPCGRRAAGAPSAGRCPERGATPCP
jgi:hypothetical protein